MGNVLWFNIPAQGHINPTLPVVAELVRRGHGVTYYSNDDTRGPIERSGARFAAYPESSLPMRELLDSTKSLFPLGPLLLRAGHQLVPFSKAEMLRAEPDLIVYDGLAVWAGIAARLVDFPVATSFPMLVLRGSKLELGRRNNMRLIIDRLRSMRAAKREVARLEEDWGADAVRPPLLPSMADKNLVFLAPSFQHPTPAIDDTFVLVGPSIDERTREAIEWEPPAGEGPLVYVSLGTINNQSRSFYREVFKAFGNYPARFVLYVPSGIGHDAFGPIPENFIVSDRVPQLRMLEVADAFVTHGGMGSLQESLYHGVPQVVVPQQIEQVVNGRRSAALGAAVIIGDQPPFGRTKAPQLRRALDRVLRSETFRLAARRLGDDAREAGGYVRAADEIEGLMVSRTADS